MLPFLFEHYHEVEDETEKMLDNLKETIIVEGSKLVQPLPESSDKRKLHRQLKVISGEHYRREALVTVLERPAVNQTEISKDARKLFTQRITFLRWGELCDRKSCPCLF